MFDLIGKGCKAIYVFFAGHPEGHDEWYSIDIYISHGCGTRKQITKAFRKALSVFDVPSDQIDEAIEELFEDGCFPSSFFRDYYNRGTGDWILDKLIDGVTAYKVKRSLEKADLGIKVELFNQTGHYKQYSALYALRNKLNADYAVAMNAKDFERAGEIKKNLMDLGRVISGREDTLPRTIMELIQAQGLGIGGFSLHDVEF